MSANGLVGRLTAMSAEEVRFRVACEARKIAGRVRYRVRPARVNRRRLAAILDPAAGPLVAAAVAASRRGDFLAAHVALGQHFSTRTSRWPLQAAAQQRFTADVWNTFPDAVTEARQRADRLVDDGRYDLLGYRDVLLANPPDWHADAVHGRRAPRGHWTTIPYLDPAVVGDHKITWEVSRHQYWLTLGAAHWLTGDPRYRAMFIAHARDWIEQNPPLHGVNWTSMLELGFRTLSWTWAIEFFAGDAARDEAPWLVELLVSLDAQLTHVSQNLSRYFSPNTHLTGEALALYAVSMALPELLGSRTRLAEGRRVLLEESRRQIRADGGHAELSAHYHRYTTDFYLLALMLARAGDPEAAPALETTVRRLVAYLRTIADDRGRLPLVGDDDGGRLFRFGGYAASDASVTLGVAASLLQDTRLAVAAPNVDVAWILGQVPAAVPSTRAPWPSRVLADSGYFVSRGRDGSHLLFDAGPHGFLNGGHAHADALSVVLSVGGEPLLVDPGTATYVMDDELRTRMRSARMHNTVVLNGTEHSVPRGPFHWASRIDARLLVAETGADFDFAVGTHDGYVPARHLRGVVAMHGVGWLIVDRITGTGTIQADAWWHIHPAWHVSRADGFFSLRSATGQRAGIAMTSPDVTMVDDAALTAFAPEYGRIERGTTLCSSERGVAPFVMAAFVPAALAPAPLAVVALPEERRNEWVRCPFEIESGSQAWRLEVSFPLDPQARPSNWPQPCIEQLVRLCVE